MDIPRGVIFRHAFSKSAEYFASDIENKRRSGQVAVLVKHFGEMLFYIPCTDDGYPNWYQYKTIYTPMMWQADAQSAINETITVEELTVIVDKPIVSFRYDYTRGPIVFMWQGTISQREKVPIEKLNVSELMKLAQLAVVKREGLILDKAIENKLYK